MRKCLHLKQNTDLQIDSLSLLLLMLTASKLSQESDVQYTVMSVRVMDILEKGIRFGPFETEHHRHVVDVEFRAALLKYLSERIVPMVTVDFTKVDGLLTAEYDAPRFLGPHSTIKYRYNLRCDFMVDDLKEEARVIVDYNKKMQSFSEPLRLASVLTLAEQAQREEHHQQIEDIHRRVLDGEDPIYCPRCGAPLRILTFDRKRLFRKNTRRVKHIECPTDKCSLN